MRRDLLPRGALLLAAAFALFGCGVTGKVSRVEEQRQIAPAAIVSGDAVTIVGLVGVRDETLDCIDGELRGLLGDSHVIRPPEFRNRMFPWFEPDLTPTDTESLRKRLLQPLVRQRIADLHVRYVITIGGEMSAHEETWGGGFGNPYAIVIGGATKTEKTVLSATLLDMRQLRSVGRIEAEGKGGSGMGLIVIIPYAYSVSSMKAACRSIAGRIAAYVTGKPQAPAVGRPQTDDSQGAKP
jgi:hypothetical protein